MNDLSSNGGKCTVMHGDNNQMATGSTANQHWWPNQLNLKVLHQITAESDLWGRTSNTPTNSTA